MATVTVSTSTTTTTKTSSVHFDPNYFRTVPGLLKVLEAVLSLIGFICVMTIPGKAHGSAYGWYSFVAMTGFWVSLFVIICYMFHIVEKLHWLPWLISEMGFSAVWCVFYFIAACVAAAKAGEFEAWGAATFFGFVAMGVFGYEAYLKYRKWKSGDIAQGESQTTTTTTSATGPSYPTY